MWETTVMHKQVSGRTVNFGPNFPDQSLLRNTPPPQFRKLQIWDDQSLLRNTPPNSENFRFGMTKVYSGIPPPFRKLQIWDDQSLLRNTPPIFGKLQIWDDQSLLQNTPPQQFRNAESYYMWRLYPTGITTRLLSFIFKINPMKSALILCGMFLWFMFFKRKRTPFVLLFPKVADTHCFKTMRLC